jgi:hypothetical protein
MVYYAVKVLLSAVLIVLVTEIAKRSTLAGALIASVPLTSVLAFVWLYWDTRDAARVAGLSIDIFWGYPSLAFLSRCRCSSGWAGDSGRAWSRNGRHGRMLRRHDRYTAPVRRGGVSRGLAANPPWPPFFKRGPVGGRRCAANLQWCAGTFSGPTPL